MDSADINSGPFISYTLLYTVGYGGVVNDNNIFIIIVCSISNM